LAQAAAHLGAWLTPRNARVHAGAGMWALVLLAGHAAAWPRRHDSFIQVDVPPPCACDCCTVIDRRPNEVVNGASKACAPTTEHGEECAEQCLTAPGDSVLRAAGEVMDSQRFCFFECKPAQGFKEAKVASACLALSAEERKVSERTGNAVDPAALIAPGTGPKAVEMKPANVRPMVMKEPGVKSPAFLQLRRLRGKRQDPVELTNGVANSAREQASTTRATAKDLRTQQVKKAQEIKATADSGGGALAELMAIQASTRNAEKAAQEASKSAGEAEEAVLKARKMALEGGVQAGKEAMEQVKVADHKTTADLAAFRDKLVNKVELKAIAAAAKAAEPYHLGMLRAQDTVNRYTSQAQADMGKAKALQGEATDLANKANAAPDKASASALYDEAKAKAAEAATYAENAKSMFATADQMNQDIPKYQGAAQAAAAKAAFDSMPAWQPAPLMPFPDYAKR